MVKYLYQTKNLPIQGEPHGKYYTTIYQNFN